MANLYVGNLPWSTAEDDLRNVFSSIGSLSSVEIPQGRDGKSRGYGLVKFSTMNEAQAAIATFDGHILGGRALTVREDSGESFKTAAPHKKAAARAISEGDIDMDRRCFVGNLSWDTKEDDLLALCEGAGVKMLSVTVGRQSNGRSKGWGILIFDSAQAAAEAIVVLHDSELQGRNIIVRLERPAGAKTVRNLPSHNGSENSSGLQVVVRNLPFTMSTEDLLGMFQKIGGVETARCMCHEDTGRSKGWGIVRFATVAHAQTAIHQLDGIEFEGRALIVKQDKYE